MPTCERDGCRSKKRATKRNDGQILCDRCHRHREQEDVCDVESQESQDESVYSETDGNTNMYLVVNELLTYCVYHQQNSTRDAIKKVVTDFYTPEEIGEAKDLLWDTYGIDVLGSTKSRQSSVNRASHVVEAKDILDGISKIDLGGDSHPAVQFVAQNLARLPPVAPEELDLASMVLRLKQLECKSSSVMIWLVMLGNQSSGWLLKCLCEGSVYPEVGTRFNVCEISVESHP